MLPCPWQAEEGKCLFAMCSQSWQIVAFKGAEMKSKAAREVVRGWLDAIILGKSPTEAWWE